MRVSNAARNYFAASHELRIANIGKDVLKRGASRAGRWRWDFAMTVGSAEFQPHAHADTFEEAKASVERN